MPSFTATSADHGFVAASVGALVDAHIPLVSIVFLTFIMASHQANHDKSEKQDGQRSRLSFLGSLFGSRGTPTSGTSSTTIPSEASGIVVENGDVGNQVNNHRTPLSRGHSRKMHFDQSHQQQNGGEKQNLDTLQPSSTAENHDPWKSDIRSLIPSGVSRNYTAAANTPSQQPYRQLIPLSSSSSRKVPSPWAARYSPSTTNRPTISASKRRRLEPPASYSSTVSIDREQVGLVWNSVVERLQRSEATKRPVPSKRVPLKNVDRYQQARERHRQRIKQLQEEATQKRLAYLQQLEEEERRFLHEDEHLSNLAVTMNVKRPGAEQIGKIFDDERVENAKSSNELIKSHFQGEESGTDVEYQELPGYTVPTFSANLGPFVIRNGANVEFLADSNDTLVESVPFLVRELVVPDRLETLSADEQRARRISDREIQEKENETGKKLKLKTPTEALNESDTKKLKKGRPGAWICNLCNEENFDHMAATCAHCQKQKEVKSNWGNLFANMYANKWQCHVCRVLNDNDKNKCASCETERSNESSQNDPAALTGSESKVALTTKVLSSTTTAALIKPPSSLIGASGFVFGAATPSASTNGAPKSQVKVGGFTFGVPQSSSAASNNVKDSSSMPPFQFGSTTVDRKESQASFPTETAQSAGFVFSANMSDAQSNTQSQSGFTFGTASSTVDRKSASNSTGFVFGANSSIPESQVDSTAITSSGVTMHSPAPAPSFSFGGLVSNSSAPAPDLLSTTASSNATLRQAASAATSDSKRAFENSGSELAKRPSYTFGATQADSSNSIVKRSETNNGMSGEGAGKRPFTFGSSSPVPPSSSGAPTSSSAPPAPLGASGTGPGGPLGLSTAINQPSTTASDVAVAPVAGATSITPSAPMFGSSVPALGSSAPPSSTSTWTKAAALTFASGTSTAAAATPVAPSDKPAPASTSPTGFTFGSGAPAAPTFGNAAPTFGSSAVSAPSISAATSGVSTLVPNLTPIAPVFGSSGAPAVPTFGSGATLSAPSMGSATASTAPTFGSVTAPAAATFGSAAVSSAPTFGTSAPTAAPTIGSVNAPPAPTFGSSATPPAPTFGSATNPSAPTFGSSAASSAPVFGSATAPASTFASAGVPSAPTFGSAAPPIAPAFGSAAPPTAPTFGSAIAPAAPTFGSNAPAAPIFGSPTVIGASTAPMVSQTPSSFASSAAVGNVGVGNAFGSQQGDGGFALGSSSRSAPRGRRIVRAKRPGR